MRMINKNTFATCAGLVLMMGLVYAGPKPDEVHRLSEDLTPMGSERAGNADGSIPAWTGGNGEAWLVAGIR